MRVAIPFKDELLISTPEQGNSKLFLYFYSVNTM